MDARDERLPQNRLDPQAGTPPTQADRTTQPEDANPLEHQGAPAEDPPEVAADPNPHRTATFRESGGAE